ncbi:MAG TPA: glycosyltransferase [Candidatus Sumerlaeota bacterium]|nr:glycosyltransferase [Candidatus Sumerlaeota bacterium]
MTGRILILSFVEWSGAFQRPQHLAVGLARRGWEVTYASPGYLHRRGRGAAPGVDLPPSLRILSPAAVPGGSRLRIAAEVNRRLMAAALKRESPQGWETIIFNDPRWAGVAAALPARMRVFDCMDDLTAQAPSAEWARAREDEALRVADRIWTGTASLEARLRDQAAERGKPIRFVPCGVDADHFASPDARRVAALRPMLPPGAGPLAGYFGALNERVRGELVEALLAGGARVLLIGPTTSRAPAIVKQAGRHPGLRWTGPRPYAELPAWLALFDFAIIPYDTGGPHRFLYPVKALEYLAGGKPVLSTPLPDVLRFLGDYVETASAAEDWRAAPRRMQAETESIRKKTERGRDYARSRSWEAMVEEMLADLTRDR